MSTKKRRSGAIRPLAWSRRTRRPWALVFPAARHGLTIFTEYGDVVQTFTRSQSVKELACLEPLAVFSPQPKAVMVATDARRWTAKHRRGKLIECRMDDGPKVLPVPVEALPDRDPFAAVLTFAVYLRWAADHDVVPTGRTSWSGLGRHLFATTLRRPVWFVSTERVGRAALYGGRKAAPFPAPYVRAARFDIRGAYLHALGSRPMPLRLRPVKYPASFVLDRDVDGVAYATVRVPDELDWWAPLPMRRDQRVARVLRWETGTLEGWWSLAELRGALDAGCDVDAHEVHAGQHHADVFGPWFALMVEGRQLPDGAARLAKHHANLLWSSFLTMPARIVSKRYADEYAREPLVTHVQEPGIDFNAKHAYVGAITAARVRTQLYREALFIGEHANPHVVHVDTDGIIVGYTAGHPANIGDGIGSWRLDQRMPRLEIKAPSAYRYMCARCGDEHPAWHYCVAGCDGDRAAYLFRHVGRTHEPIDVANIAA